MVVKSHLDFEGQFFSSITVMNCFFDGFVVTNIGVVQEKKELSSSHIDAFVGWEG